MLIVQDKLKVKLEQRMNNIFRILMILIAKIQIMLTYNKNKIYIKINLVKMKILI